MKNIKYIIAACCAVLFAACQDKGEWDVPSLAQSPYGNESITETNVITIDELKNRYNREVSIEGNFAQITDDIKIKGYVTGNDRKGNLYKEFVIQDETGAITIGVAFGGMFGILPEGQEILVSLKDLYIGNYRLAATIGTPYKDKSGTDCVGRMPMSMLNSHFTFTKNKKTKEELDAMIELFADGSTPTSWSFKKDAGKLGLLKNVSIKVGGYYNNDTQSYQSGIKFVPGESRLAFPDFSTSWFFNEQPSDGNGSVQIYTSSYADFAATLAPTGKMNIKGIVKRYRQQWEFIIRDIDDIEILSE